MKFKIGDRVRILSSHLRSYTTDFKCPEGVIECFDDDGTICTRLDKKVKNWNVWWGDEGNLELLKPKKVGFRYSKGIVFEV